MYAFRSVGQGDLVLLRRIDDECPGERAVGVGPVARFAALLFLQDFAAVFVGEVLFLISTLVG